MYKKMRKTLLHAYHQTQSGEAVEKRTLCMLLKMPHAFSACENNTRRMAFYRTTQKTQSQKQMKHNNENLIDWSPRPFQLNICTQKLFILEHSISRN